jgi:hypothetical protein
MKDPTLLMMQDDPICASSGCDQYKHPEATEEPPRDYPVQDLGQDHEIRDTLASEEYAAKALNKQWAFKTPQTAIDFHNPATDIDYNFKPEYDQDIAGSLSNLAHAEGGRWTW